MVWLDWSVKDCACKTACSNSYAIGLEQRGRKAKHCKFCDLWCYRLILIRLPRDLYPWAQEGCGAGPYAPGDAPAERGNGAPNSTPFLPTALCYVRVYPASRFDQAVHMSNSWHKVRPKERERENERKLASRVLSNPHHLCMDTSANAICKLSYT